MYPSPIESPATDCATDTTVNNIQDAHTENNNSYTFSSSANYQKYVDELFEVNLKLQNGLFSLRQNATQLIDGKTDETYLKLKYKDLLPSKWEPVKGALDSLIKLFPYIKNSIASHQDILFAAPYYLEAVITILKQPSINNLQEFDKITEKFLALIIKLHPKSDLGENIQKLTDLVKQFATAGYDLARNSYVYQNIEPEFVRQYQALLTNNTDMALPTGDSSSLENYVAALRIVEAAIKCNADKLANISLLLKDFFGLLPAIQIHHSTHNALDAYLYALLQEIVHPNITSNQLNAKGMDLYLAIAWQPVNDMDLAYSHFNLYGELDHQSLTTLKILRNKAFEAAIEIQKQKASEEECLAHYQQVFFDKTLETSPLNARYFKKSNSEHNIQRQQFDKQGEKLIENMKQSSASSNNVNHKPTDTNKRNGAGKWAAAISLLLIGAGLCITGILTFIGLPLIIAGGVIAAGGLIYNGHLAYNKISGKSSVIDIKKGVTSTGKITNDTKTPFVNERRPLTPPNAMKPNLYWATTKIENSSHNQNDLSSTLYDYSHTK